MKKKTEFEKLLWQYDKADMELRAAVKAMFPEGCRVRCRLSGNLYIVKAGSLYADQVYTNIGHAGVRHIERME